MVGSPVVVIAGPATAGAFLERVRLELAESGPPVVLLTGPGALACFERWESVRVVVPFALPFAAEEMDRAPRLQAIVVPSLGYEGIDLDAATERGIIVANGAAQENFDSVAEAAVMLILMCLYDIREAERRLRDNMPRQGPSQARMLRGKTVGLIGWGNIAHALAARLASWQVQLLVHTRSAIDEGHIEQVELHELVARSDVVVPLVPLTAQTHHLLSREVLARLKPGAVLVNLSRGAVIDEAALAEPAIASRLGGIALDVFETEPLPPDSPLRRLPGAILTPHEISHTQENLAALLSLTIANVEAVLRGERPKTQVNAFRHSRL